MKNNVFYYLTIEDIQTVSNQEIGRELSTQEIESIKEEIVKRINWYESIADSIAMNLKEISK